MNNLTTMKTTDIFIATNFKKDIMTQLSQQDYLSSLSEVMKGPMEIILFFLKISIITITK